MFRLARACLALSMVALPGLAAPIPGPTPVPSGKLVLSEAEWRKRLTAEQYHVLREHGTECALTGAFWDNHRPGDYHCAGCGQLLFTSETKFDSGTGWPSFFRPATPGAVVNLRDRSYGMERTEIRCSRCDGHLGHVFEDGPAPTGLRFCTNSAAFRFVERPARKR